MNNLRKFVTSGVGFAFVVVGVTGVIFQFFFKNHPLEQIHGWLGVALVVAAALHITQNWPSMRNHLRNWRVYGLLVPIVLVVAFFSFGHRENGGNCGGVNPRVIVQRLSHGRVSDVAKAFGQDVGTVLAAMQSDGLRVEDSGETLQDLAHRNQKSPEAVLAYFAK